MMTYEENLAYINKIYGLACAKGLCRTRAEFAKLIDFSPTTLSGAMSGSRPENLTDKMVGKVVMFSAANNLEADAPPEDEGPGSVLVIPYGARGGTIGDFLDGVHEYDCEKIASPIKGADYAMEVTGDSMSPEYPSGSRVLIKKINPVFIEWNEVYVLDTPNGAVIKRVRMTEDPDQVECVSINPAYQPYRVPVSFVRGWYRVLMVMSLK